MYKVLTLLNCWLFWLMVGAVSTAPHMKGTFWLYQHSCEQQRCPSCTPLSYGVPILPGPSSVPNSY